MDGGYKYFAEDKNTRSFIERAMSDLACETFSKFRVYFSEQRPLWDEEKWLTRYDEFMEELNSDFNEGLEDVKLHYFIYCEVNIESRSYTRQITIFSRSDKLKVFLESRCKMKDTIKLFDCNIDVEQTQKKVKKSVRIMHRFCKKD